VGTDGVNNLIVLATSGKAIGGHEGIEVLRVPEGVIKIARKSEARSRVENEARVLRRLAGTGIAPELIIKEGAAILITDLGDRYPHPVQSEEALRRSAIRLLWQLRVAGIRHGDATDLNTIIVGDQMKLVDFEEAHFWDDPTPDKRDRPDSYYVWQTVAGTPSLSAGPPDTSRIVRRWAAIAIQLNVRERDGVGPEGKTLLDLGCHTGDITAMARVDGLDVVGVDRGDWPHVGFDSVTAARALWGDMGCQFESRDILKLPDAAFARDVVLLLSSWAYIVRDYGKDNGIELLARIVGRCGVLFFEPHLCGDGPGPDFLKSEDDVAALLKRVGDAEPIITLPVAGREASRTVWQVSKHRRR
jgi:hypothetical protein